jgi:hypothetical protein
VDAASGFLLSARSLVNKCTLSRLHQHYKSENELGQENSIRLEPDAYRFRDGKMINVPHLTSVIFALGGGD